LRQSGLRERHCAADPSPKISDADDESISTSIRNGSSKSRLEAENAALRHQLIVLQRRGLLAKTLRSIAPSSTWAASHRGPSWVDFIIIIAESDFRYAMTASPSH
jgi:hypothetical protein